MEEKNCLKCGRPCPDNQSFCNKCREEMEKYPVKPGVVVLLPQQNRQAKVPSRRRHTLPSPEEQLAKLKKRVAALWLALILSLAALGAMGYLVVTEYIKQQEPHLLPGQNYSSENSTQPDATH